jgi:hypothetical protein
MALINQGGKLLLRDGKLGTGQACCCNKCSGPCDGENPCPPGCVCVDGQCVECGVGLDGVSISLDGDPDAAMQEGTDARAPNVIVSASYPAWFDAGCGSSPTAIGGALYFYNCGYVIRLVTFQNFVCFSGVYITVPTDANGLPAAGSYTFAGGEAVGSDDIDVRDVIFGSTFACRDSTGQCDFPSTFPTITITHDNPFP